MKTEWILATVLALSFSPALTQAKERTHKSDRNHKSARAHSESRHRSPRAQVRRHEVRRHSFHRVRRYRGARVSVHIHPSYLPRYRHGYFWSAGFYYPRYYFDYNACPNRASLRIQAHPREAEVYVDGYYAGIVNDFDGTFQRLNVVPGTHEITLRLDGFATWSARVYASPYSTLRIHHDLMPGPAAEVDMDADADEPGSVYEY